MSLGRLGKIKCLTPRDSWIMTTEPGKPAEFMRALRRGVTLSALLAMYRIGWLVFPVKGPLKHVSSAN